MRAEHERGTAGRFGPGLPRISDGQLLFLLHMLAHTKEPKEGGSRIAIIMNGSPLFTGDAGSGESEIRRFILENDLLEALIALPEQLFYNTGIATYVWVVTNRKAPERKGKVQLIDATSFWVPMRKSLGDKRREIPLDRAQDILKILADFKDGDTRTVDEGRQGRRGRRQPHLPDHALRLPQDHRRASAPAQLPGERRSASRASKRRRASRPSRSRRRRVPQAPRSRPRAARSRRRSASSSARCPTRSSRTGTSSSACSTAPRRRRGSSSPLPSGRRSSPPSPSATRRRPSAATRTATPSPTRSCATPRACRSSESVEAFFEREVKPHVPDAWIDTDKRDPKDGQVGIVGYEINFNRYFYRYTPPRPLEEIEADIRAIETGHHADAGGGDGWKRRDDLMCGSVGSYPQVPTVCHILRPSTWSKCRDL